MNFGGPAFFIDRSDINTDEIIPAKYLTEISKQALKSHLLEDLHLFDTFFDPQAPELLDATVLVTRSNFGCGSSREHAVWALEVNDIKVVIHSSYIFNIAKKWDKYSWWVQYFISEIEYFTELSATYH